MKATGAIVSDQDNVVVTDVTKQDEEEGECSDTDIPPPPPPKVSHTPSQASKTQRASAAINHEAVEHSEEGECDSESEEGELGEGEFHTRNTEGRNKGRNRLEGKRQHGNNMISTVKHVPGPPVAPLPLDPVQRRLKDMSSKRGGGVPEKELSYRDRDYRERGDRKDDRKGAGERNGHEGDQLRNLERINRSLDFRKDVPKSMRPGDMPSLISLPPMPQITSNAKGIVPDFPPITISGSGSTVSGGPTLPLPPHPFMPPVGGAVWPPAVPHMPPPMPMPPVRPGERSRDDKLDESKMKDYFDVYNKAWQRYYDGMRDKKSSRSSPFKSERRSRERSTEKSDRGHQPASNYHLPPPHPGMPGMPPAPFPGMPAYPGMPLPHADPNKSTESAWERGLKASKKIRDELKRNEKSESESDEPGVKLKSKIVMKKEKSRSPSSHDTRARRRPMTPPEDDNFSNGHRHPHHHHHRLTPERYKGAYERRPVDERAGPSMGEPEWKDPWMRTTSPKDHRKRIVMSSSSSDSSSDDSTPPHHGKPSLQELKRTIRRAKKYRKWKDNRGLSPPEYEALRKRMRRGSDLPRNYAKPDSDSDSDDSDGSSSSSSSAESISPSAGKLADSPTSPLSSPNIKDAALKKKKLFKQLQKIEEQLKNKKKKRKKDERRKHS